MFKKMVKNCGLVLIVVSCLVSISYQTVTSDAVHSIEEGGFLKLYCSGRIKIVWAWYGIPGTNCKSLSALEVSKKRCDGHGTCELGATNNNFGDPCPGHKKSLSILYRCESGEISKTIGDSYSGPVETVIEGELLRLSCVNNYKIQIMWAMYGIQGTNCDINVSGTVQKRCDGKYSCNVVASNSNFYDTCPGVKKVLSVIYRCYSEPAPNYLKDSYPGFFKTVKEDSIVDLTCNRDRSIFVDWAWYGIEGTGCRATTPYEVIKQRCDGLIQCKVRAVNRNFGDPCKGLKKSLTVLYRCLTKEDLDCSDK